MMRETRRLPNETGAKYLTDGGIETTLIFEDGLDLPCFAAFHLLRDAAGREALRRYYRRHAAVAQELGAGFIFESATWRASADWGARLGYDAAALETVNLDAIRLMREVQGEFPELPSVISGCIGPRGDGYVPGEIMQPEEAERFHGAQAAVFARANVDLITGVTINNLPEALGIARAARRVGVPAVLGLTVETDGDLPDRTRLGEAIETIDRQAPGAVAYYMINCAHPDHFRTALAAGGAWRERISAVRANASRLSHAELDEAEELDSGNPEELARDYADLHRYLPKLCVYGGCCGTDHRHVRQIGLACVAEAVG